jgi:hypothetical protein
MEVIMERDEKREYWQAVLDLYRESGMGVKGFCEKEGVSIHQFGYWRKRLRETTVSQSDGFVALQFADESSPQSIRVRIGSFAVEVPAGFDGEDLKRVLVALASVAC